MVHMEEVDNAILDCRRGKTCSALMLGMRKFGTPSIVMSMVEVCTE